MRAPTRGLLVGLVLLSQAVCAADKAWVHGSWVNLRAAPNTSAAVRTQLTTNTEVALLERGETWCMIGVPSGPEGHVLCSLLGAEPLTLQQASGNPARSFWIAPSVGRLIAYGSLLRTGPAYQRMFSKLEDGQIAHIRPLPEFDAAKRLMEAGVVPRVAAEIDRGAPVEPSAMTYAALIAPRPIKPSLFRHHGDAVLASEGDADTLAAVTSTRIAVKVVAPPVGYVAKHEGPELSGITGFGDVGEAELRFSPPMLMYFLLPNGLVSASHLPEQESVGPRWESQCGHYYYAARSYHVPLDDLAWVTLKLGTAAGFPAMSESMRPMAMLVTAKPLPRKKVTIRSRAARIPDVKMPAGYCGPQARPMSAAKVVLHEADLNGDDVADILIWDTPNNCLMSLDFNLHREWYLNIDGQWYWAGGMDEQECS